MRWARKAVDLRVPDVDAAIGFHRGRVCRVVDHDVTVDAGRVAQLTPPSRCSIAIGEEVRPGGTAVDNAGSTHCEDTGDSSWAVQQISVRA